MGQAGSALRVEGIRCGAQAALAVTMGSDKSHQRAAYRPSITLMAPSRSPDLQQARQRCSRDRVLVKTLPPPCNAQKRQLTSTSRCKLRVARDAAAEVHKRSGYATCVEVFRAALGNQAPYRHGSPPAATVAESLCARSLH